MFHTEAKFPTFRSGCRPVVGRRLIVSSFFRGCPGTGDLEALGKNAKLLLGDKSIPEMSAQFVTDDPARKNGVVKLPGMPRFQLLILTSLLGLGVSTALPHGPAHSAVDGFSEPSVSRLTDRTAVDDPLNGLIGVEPAGQDQPSFRLAFSTGLTNSVVGSIAEIERACASVSRDYRIDCLGDGFKWVAGRMPSNPDYRDLRATMNKTGSRLQSIARKNRDREKPDLDTAKTSQWKGAKKFTPVQSSKLAAATAEAVAVIKETETRLLRSAENSEHRRVHYQKIAGAVGSTTRILRS